MLDHDAILDLLKHNLQKAQAKMKYAGRRRSDGVVVVGKHVYLKLQPSLGRAKEATKAHSTLLRAV